MRRCIDAAIFDFHVIEISKVTHSRMQIIRPSETRKAHHSLVNQMINDSSHHFSITPPLISRIFIT